MNISRFGRSFSILKVPYAFKLLIQELQVMNVQMRIITEENVDQLLSMSYSDNINKLLKSDKPIEELIKSTNFHLRRNIDVKDKNQPYLNERPVLPDPANIDTPDSPPYAPYSPAYSPPNSPEYNPTSPPYNPDSPPYAPTSPPYNPNSSSTPNSPSFTVHSLDYPPNSPDYPPPNSPRFTPHTPDYSLPNSTSSKEFIINPNILDVPEEKKEEEKQDESLSTDSGEKKVIIQDSNTSSSDATTSSGTKKITL